MDAGRELTRSRQPADQSSANALTLVLCAACVLAAAGCATVRSAYVPMPLASGAAPGRGRAELAVRTTGMPGVERASAPAAESLYVPNLAVDFAIAVRAARYFAFRLEGGFAAPESAMPAGAAEADRPADAVGHGGFGILFMIPFDDPRSSVHLTLDQSIFFLPARVCEAGGECGRTTTMQMLVLEGGVYASHAPIPELRITGGVALRNQPLFGAAFGGASDTTVGFGNVALILYAALEVHVTEWLAFVPEIQWAPGFLPFLPLPSVGLGIAFTLPGGPGSDPFQSPGPPDGIWGARDLGSPVRP